MSSLQLSHRLIGSAQRVVRMSLDLLGAEGEWQPDRITRVLNSSGMQAEIRRVLEREVRDLLSGQRRTLPPGGQPGPELDARAVADAIAGGRCNIAPAEYLESVRGNAPFRELEQSLGEVLSDFKAAPLGTWIERNRSVVVIAAAVLTIGTGTAFFVVRTGDIGTAPVAGTGRELKLGSLELKPQLIEFSTADRRIGLRVDGAAVDRPRVPLVGAVVDDRNGFTAAEATTVRLERPVLLSLGSECGLAGFGPAESARAQGLAGPWSARLPHHAYATLEWRQGALALSGLALVGSNVPGAAWGATYRSITPIGLISVGGPAELTTQPASVRGVLSLPQSLGNSILEFNAALSCPPTRDRLGPLGQQVPLPAAPWTSSAGDTPRVLHFTAL